MKNKKNYGKETDPKKGSGYFKDSFDRIKHEKLDAESRQFINESYYGSSDEGIDLNACRNERKESSSSGEPDEDKPVRSRTKDNRHVSEDESEDDSEEEQQNSAKVCWPLRSIILLTNPTRSKVVNV